jgi:NAD(P)-dependent dehydrogenase (short-subunit alcohol dehydrogenase family)
MKELAGKVAVITGAASGIGLSLCRHCAAEGMRVVLADIEADALDAALGEIRAGGSEAIAVRTDVSDAGQVKALAGAAVEAYGAVHLLCNNAGVGVGTSVWEASLDDWRWVLGVNLWGVIHGVHAFVPLFLEQGGEAHIVNTASIQGLITHHPLCSPYQVSKHAVVSLSEQLHFELGRRGANVGVSVLCPGWVRTRIGTSIRNRPDNPNAEQTAPFTPDQEDAVDYCIQALENGAEADEVAARALENGAEADEVAASVIAAIRENRFYVLPHPQWLPLIRARMEGILDGRAPATAEI